MSSLDNYSGSADSATFTGDVNGSDNWEIICSIDPEGTANAAKNYPAFNYVNNYASTYDLTGDYATGWYMPTIAELCYMYRNKAVLNFVLDAIDGVQLSDGSYGSSSQYREHFDVWNLVFRDGNIDNDWKTSTRLVCCVRAFNLEQTEY